MGGFSFILSTIYVTTAEQMYHLKKHNLLIRGFIFSISKHSFAAPIRLFTTSERWLKT